jgi:hypothetical protein
MVTYWESNTYALHKILLCVYIKVYNTMCRYILWDKGGGVLNTEQTPRSGDLIKHTCLTTPVTSHIAPYINVYLKVLLVKIIIKNPQINL